jgi:hypothetical protein
VPPEEFHLLKEGLTKQMLTRLFVSRKGRRSREIMDMFSGAYQRMTVFTETARRPRKIQVLQMKGSELGVIAMAVFPSLFRDFMHGSSSDW